MSDNLTGTATGPVCSECGWIMRSEDSGHDVCLYCRLPDLLDQARYVADEDYAGRVYVSEDRLTMVNIRRRLLEEAPYVTLAVRESEMDTWPPQTPIYAEGEPR